MDSEIKPDANRVEETLLRQQDPANWSEEAWAAYDADVEQLKKINFEALNPTSPAPGHAKGCVCHRCRMYREQKEHSLEGQE